MGGISINNNISPVNSCEGTQDNNKKENKSSFSLDFGQMIFDNIRRERNLSQQKKEAEEEKEQEERKQPDPTRNLHQQYMMMGDYISSFKKKEEKK